MYGLTDHSRQAAKAENRHVVANLYVSSNVIVCIREIYEIQIYTRLYYKTKFFFKPVTSEIILIYANYKRKRYRIARSCLRLLLSRVVQWTLINDNGQREPRYSSSSFDAVDLYSSFY